MRQERLVGSSFGVFSISGIACGMLCCWTSRSAHTAFAKIDVEFCRLLRRLVGPPGGVDWSLPWHQILHSWNQRVRHCCKRFGRETWSTQYLRQYWRLASYIALLPSLRGVKGVLQCRAGRVKMMWDENLLLFADGTRAAIGPKKLCDLHGETISLTLMHSAGCEGRTHTHTPVHYTFSAAQNIRDR